MLEILQKNSSVRETFTEHGNSWTVSPEFYAKLEEAGYMLCAQKAVTTDINTLRYHHFCAQKGKN